MRYKLSLLILCLVSGFGVVHAQKPDRAQKSDAAAKPAGPTIEATQQYIADLLATPEKSRGTTFSGSTGVTDTKNKYKQFIFTGNCRATYTDEYVIERTYPFGNGFRKTTTLSTYDLDFSRLKLQYEPDPSSATSNFLYPVFSSKREIEDIPFQYVESIEGERKNANGDMVDASKPDVSGTSKRKSVRVLVQFLGIYEEKAKKAFDHLLSECAKRSGEPKELF